MLSSIKCFVLCGVASMGLAAPLQSFSVDLSPQSQAAFDPALLTRCFGSSHASTALRADWRKQLAEVHEDLGTEFVRFHGLLNDDMSAVVRARAKQAADDSSAEQNHQTCKFVKDLDFADPGAGVFNASTKEKCCQLCYTKSTGLPEPCVAATWAPWGGGQCYFKLGNNIPVQKNGTGCSACITDRKSPKAFTYSWINVFSIFDFLVSIGMRPIVEIGFMPSLLASDPSQTVFWYKGGISAPKSYDDWNDFMKAFARALIDRYGIGEVRKWYFEVW